MITKLKIGQLYEIDGKCFILCASEFKHGKNNTPIVKFYFKKPTFEDGQAYSYSKLKEKLENDKKV
jgi:hypothetical protein